MVHAARQGGHAPAWWVAEVIRHERRCPDLAVLTLRPGQPFPFQPGQYLSVQVTRWPRVWRTYSIGNAPRPDGTLDLHVRAIPGGQVSTALVQQTAVGDSGAARSRPGQHGRRPGFAPGHAVRGRRHRPGPDQGDHRRAGRAARPGRADDPRCSGARQQQDLYDLPDLVRLQAACRGLEVITALSDDPAATGVHGLLPDVVRMHAAWRDRDMFIRGPPGMVSGTLRVLAHRASGEHVHLDPAPSRPAELFRHWGTLRPRRRSPRSRRTGRVPRPASARRSCRTPAGSLPRPPGRCAPRWCAAASGCWPSTRCRWPPHPGPAAA